MRNTKPLFSLLLLLFGSVALLPAQSINMGGDPIFFGPSCNNAFVRNTSTGNKIAFGANAGCTGGSFLYETIHFNTGVGRIGVGVASPSYQIHLSANSAAKPGSSVWTVISDRRFKEDIQPYRDGLSLIRGIDPVTFRYKKGLGIETGEEFVGVIAQDLQEVAPYMVQPLAGESDEGYLAVDLHALNFMLVNAVKELDVQLQVANAENKALASRLAHLEAQMAALFKTGDASSAQENDEAGALQVGPNPADQEVSVNVEVPQGAQAAELVVSDLQGIQHIRSSLESLGLQSTHLSTQQLPSGTYLLGLWVDGSLVSQTKLVVQH